MNPKCQCGTTLTEVEFYRNDDDTIRLEWACRNSECKKRGHVTVDEVKP